MPLTFFKKVLTTLIGSLVFVTNILNYWRSFGLNMGPFGLYMYVATHMCSYWRSSYWICIESCQTKSCVFYIFLNKSPCGCVLAYLIVYSILIT